MSRLTVAAGVLCSGLFLSAGPAAECVRSQERVLLPTDVPPSVRGGRAFVPLRSAARVLGARVAWRPGEKEVTLSSVRTSARLRVGSSSATVNGRPVRLDAAPFIESGRIMVPVRFAAEALEIPVRYDSRPRTVLVGPGPDGRLWALPLETGEPGIVIHGPMSGEAVTSPLRVHGQANAFEGTVIVELRDAADGVLARGVGTGAMGSFGPFNVDLTYSLPAGVVQEGRLFAFEPSARREGEILRSVSLPLTIR